MEHELVSEENGVCVRTKRRNKLMTTITFVVACNVFVSTFLILICWMHQLMLVGRPTQQTKPNQTRTQSTNYLTNTFSMTWVGSRRLRLRRFRKSDV